MSTQIGFFRPKFRSRGRWGLREVGVFPLFSFKRPPAFFFGPTLPSTTNVYVFLGGRWALEPNFVPTLGLSASFCSTSPCHVGYTRQIPREDTPECKKKGELGRERKNARNFGPHTSRDPTLRASHFFQVWSFTLWDPTLVPSSPPTLLAHLAPPCAHPVVNQVWPNQV